MSDAQFLTLLVYMVVVGGAWYHGFSQGVKQGAGNMYDYLKERGKKGKKWTTVRLLNEPEDGAMRDVSEQEKT